MSGRGIDATPIRWPAKYDPAFFERLFRETMALADIRNALQGSGISIEGNPSEPATIAASADVLALLTASLVTATPEALLPQSRVLTAGSGITITDTGDALIVSGGSINWYDIVGVPIYVDSPDSPAWDYRIDGDVVGYTGIAGANDGIASGSLTGDLVLAPTDGRVYVAEAPIYQYITAPNGATTQLLGLSANNPALTDIELFEVSYWEAASVNGLNLAMWDVAQGGTGARGIRWRIEQGGAGATTWRFYQHHNSDAGTELMRGVANVAALQMLVPLQGPNGAATSGNVSYSFSSETSTGMFLFSTNDIGWSVNGTTKMLLSGTRFRTSAAAQFADTSINVELESAEPVLLFDETDATANERQWRWRSVAGVLRLDTYTDAGAFGANAIFINRTGTTVSEIELNATALDFNGAADFSTTVTVNGVLTVGDGDLADGDILLTLALDRSWSFKQSSDGASAALVLQSNVDAKSFSVRTQGGSDFFTFNASNAAPNVVLTAAFADLFWTVTGADVDEGRWRTRATSTAGVGFWSLTTVTDTGAFGTNALLITRGVGTAIEEIELNATTLDFNGQILASVGSAAAPTYAFHSGSADVGLYLTGGGSLGIAVAGTLIAAFNANAQNTLSDGTALLPALAFINDVDSGVYRVGSNNVGIAAGGALVANFSTSVAQINTTTEFEINTTTVDINATTCDVSGALTVGGALSNSVGAAATPSITFTGDLNTGIFSPAADQVGMAAGGAEVARFDADATAGNTRFMIYDVDNATLERVTVGAADSGGVGFKVLRIPN